MTYAILSFKLVTAPYVHESAEEGTPAQLGVEVVPLIDGALLPDPGGLFDAIDLLLYGVGNAETDLYTCSCGCAGCAGFHEEVQLRHLNDVMAWEFPEKPFRKVFVGERFPDDSPLRIEFDAGQYAQALATLEADLAALFAASDIPVVVQPGWSCEQSGASTFAKMMKKARKNRARYQARCAAQRDAEGDLVNFMCIVHLPDNLKLSCSLTSLAWDLVHGLGQYDDDENLRTLKEEVRPKLLADPLAGLLSLSAEGRARAFSAPSLGFSDEVWLTAHYEVLPYEQGVEFMQIADAERYARYEASLKERG